MEISFHSHLDSNKSDRYKILYFARQLCCRGMYKKLLRSIGRQGELSSNLNWANNP